MAGALFAQYLGHDEDEKRPSQKQIDDEAPDGGEKRDNDYGRYKWDGLKV